MNPMEPRPRHRPYDSDVPTSTRHCRLPVQDVLQIPASAFSNGLALHFSGTGMSFWEFRQHVLPMADALASSEEGLGSLDVFRTRVRIPGRGVKFNPNRLDQIRA